MKTTMKKVSIFAPTSIGNVSVGFDSLGLALIPVDGTLLGDIVHVEVSDDNNNHLNCVGDYQHILPQKKEENIIWQCLLEFNRHYENKGHTTQKVNLTLEKNIPICSGLGSSACSVVAGIHALNEFYGKPFSENDCLALMGKLEAQISGSLHYDNVAPCFLGGLQMMLESEEKICQSLPTFDDCYWVVSYPDIPVSTKMAREILPDNYSRSDVILSARRFAAFVDASYRQDKKQAFSVLKDVIAEPYRISLFGNFDNTKEALLQSGCLAVGISGSGPAVFAACDSLEKAEKAKQIFDELYVPKDETKKGFTHICKVDTLGSRII